MRGPRDHREAGLRFAATPEAVEGYGGRGVDGTAYRPPAGYLFQDRTGGQWWIIFQEFPHAGSRRPAIYGDVLACPETHDELVRVRVLASNVNRVDADAAFEQNGPSNYEEAVEITARIPRATP